jgi:hypothetical protein
LTRVSKSRRAPPCPGGARWQRRDPGPDGPDRLDELLDRFVERGYAAEGAEIEGGDPGGHEEPGHGHHAELNVREFEHRGHRVRIASHYDVTIDGEPWARPIQVLSNGSVISHDLPQYVVPSAVDLVRAVIDQSYEAPEEIQAVVRAAREKE